LSDLLDDPVRAARLTDGGRQHTLDRWQTAQFDQLWRTMVEGSAAECAA